MHSAVGTQVEKRRTPTYFSTVQANSPSSYSALFICLTSVMSKFRTRQEPSFLSNTKNLSQAVVFLEVVVLQTD